MLVLVVNVTAAIGAFGFGYLQDAIGHVRAMALMLVGWIVMIATRLLRRRASPCSGSPPTSPACAWAPRRLPAAPSSAISRRPTRNAEFFGLWGLAVKAASIFGPLTYGAVTWIFDGNHRLGILAVGAYFVVGLILLDRHRRRARTTGRNRP